MTIRVAILHKTSYEFDRDVNVSPHILRLRPAPHSRTHIHAYSLKVTPDDHLSTGNRIRLVTIKRVWCFRKRRASWNLRWK